MDRSASTYHQKRGHVFFETQCIVSMAVSVRSRLWDIQNGVTLKTRLGVTENGAVR